MSAKANGFFKKSLPQTVQILEREAKGPSVPALYPLQVFRTVPDTGECYISVVTTQIPSLIQLFGHIFYTSTPSDVEGMVKSIARKFTISSYTEIKYKLVFSLTTLAIQNNFCIKFSSSVAQQHRYMKAIPSSLK